MSKESAKVAIPVVVSNPDAAHKLPEALSLKIYVVGVEPKLGPKDPGLPGVLSPGNGKFTCCATRLKMTNGLAPELAGGIKTASKSPAKL